MRALHTMSLDFNHGSEASSEDMGAGPISDRINRLVDAAMTARNTRESLETPRPYVGASMIASHCSRAIQLEYIHNKYGNLPADPEPFSGETCRIFIAGHVFEDMAARALQEAGFGLDTGYWDNHNKWRQHGFREFGDEFRGHYDGIIRSGPVFEEWPRLWECKALKHSSVLDVMNKGLEESKPTYYGQVQINQLKSGITDPCWFTIIDKDTAKWHHLLIGHEPEKARALQDRAKHIIDTTEKGQLISRPFPKSSDFNCRVFCSRWKKVCWKKLPD